ncbi:hypothetical protein PpBr36_05249 [Pyricularia pennisetigena]|uniref:hypothetical protein n=1 Tax=Pyricularia pennisetigena TaxID=1578925 RepID=UPI00114EBDB5|nr:hypothetical protein PpBr36_05249 [Pyricularia pennisetigena]TLS26966.1 hypothetical protein PpBr36_05249 [Pyricularia pennisetigena]
MPIGIQRLNAKRSQPNPNVIFIKPLKGPNEATAQDFLERIAAQCVPIMKEHGISIMSLEEYEPNREFWGRNFNAGEVIQLVLRSPLTGRWLPFEHVQMVMMHELAHCKQMNHSRAFWAVRNLYADQMRALWGRGYTGEGLWGRGTSLKTGDWEANTVLPDEPLPEHLCGGTYRSRRRKRKGPELTYQQKKERRILKKFGKGGVALGEDVAVKAELEKGKRTAAKPRVAGSKRGRELRAAAALARFGQQQQSGETEPVVKKEKKQTQLKTEPITVKDEDEPSTASDPDTEDDYEDEPGELGLPDAVDIDGKTTLVDNKGHGMVKVCEDENPDDQDARQELVELRSTFRGKGAIAGLSKAKTEEPMVIKEEDISTASEPDTDGEGQNTPLKTATSLSSDQSSINGGKNRISSNPPNRKPAPQTSSASPALKAESSPNHDRPKAKTLKSSQHSPPVPQRSADLPALGSSSTPTTEANGHDPTSACSVCSFANEKGSFRCAVCSNVLDPGLDARSWRCSSDACAGSAYVNAGDCGVCGVCGQRKSSGV